MHRPSCAPALACRIASRLVESIESKRRILKLISLLIRFAREESILATSELTNTATQRYHCVASGLHQTGTFTPGSPLGNVVGVYEEIWENASSQGVAGRNKSSGV